MQKAISGFISILNYFKKFSRDIVSDYGNQTIIHLTK